PSQGIECANIVLEAWQRTEESRPGGVAGQRCPIAPHKIDLQPGDRPHVFRDTHKRGGEESSGGLPEQMEPRLSFFQRPDFQLMSEGSEFCSCEKIFKFWCGCWHTTHDLVATDAGKHDATPLGGQAHPDLRRRLAIVAGSLYKAITRRFGR